MDFISAYVGYTEQTESPHIFHRWCAITGVGTLLARNTFLEFGHFRIFPNIYCMLIGKPGARKTSAISVLRKLISKAGYTTFAADKTTKEKFLVDLDGSEEEIEAAAKGGSKKEIYDAVTSSNLWGTSTLNEPREVFICADEFNEFAGAGNLEFYSLLGALWDWDKEDTTYTYRLKNSRSVSIFQPTISILGGNTTEKFAHAFPPEILDHGFLSRLLLIHGEKSDRKYTIPPTPEVSDTEIIISSMREIRGKRKPGAIQLLPGAFKILDSIYQDGIVGTDDLRFSGYNERRFTHLIKLCIIVAASCLHEKITEEDVVFAHTMLVAAEVQMPRAIGEFGKSKNSDVANKILDILSVAQKPLNAKDIWGQVHQDLDDASAMGKIIQGLLTADKIQSVKGAGGAGFLLKKKIVEAPKYVDFSLLTEEEREALP